VTGTSATEKHKNEQVEINEGKRKRCMRSNFGGRGHGRERVPDWDYQAKVPT